MSTELMMAPEKKKHKKDESRGQTQENPVVIKRYQNRKHYSTQANEYVTLPQMVQLVEKNVFIKSVCNKTKADLTGTMLVDLLAIKMKDTLNLNDPEVIQKLHDLIKQESIV